MQQGDIEQLFSIYTQAYDKIYSMSQWLKIKCLNNLFLEHLILTWELNAAHVIQNSKRVYFSIGYSV